MFEIIRDAAKMGLGALSLSKENLKKITDDLVEVGKMSKKEGNRLFKELEDSKKEYHKNLSDFVEKNVKKALDQAGLASKKEVDQLKKKIAELEKVAKAKSAKPSAKAKKAKAKAKKKTGAKPR